ncbi:choice-of-anchor J domain-containing protein [Chryseobacterium cucumeris]|uniref:T9SS C-terminal target domain-containing protein n=3 Tax=Chryseobacterium cucumeris TaxID=1813611 RepID=A0ABX9XCG6_9FLAO|nr:MULTISPECIES: choice-of-anchor J domain-containing protein [Chryseobacterium]QWT87622.1 T9SS type A sorting domain-containing protein [Chryseobacterium sp. PCH239]ROH95102.1 T9SS C-terminal target domain-containing protein [Chryseobacterium cucumeris]
MKLQLLLGALMFTALTANAQVSNINENFNNFTAGNTTFPQFGWSAIVAPITGEFPPVPPRMIVAGDSNRFVQSYAGNNATGSSYLITPQIETPTGNKTLTFDTTLVSPSPGPGSIQIGVASNPADMSTFVPVGSPINVSVIGTVQNISVNIPASTGSYIVFKFTPTATHVAIQVDNVVYNTTASLGVSDNNKSTENFRFALNSDQSAIEFIAKKDPKNIQIYSAAGQKAAEGKLNGQRFDISTLQTGVYYMNIETAEGKFIQSKFIKK